MKENEPMKQAIVKWFQSKGGFAHAMAGAFASLMIAYAAVPAFAHLCNSVYALIPQWGHEAILAGLGLYAWYSKTGKNS